jgi:alanine dehydrogenase
MARGRHTERGVIRIGIPAERKVAERRVALTPDGVRKLVRRGYSVTVEAAAGTAAGHPDDRYRDAGARISVDRAELGETANVVLKVKEPIPEEYCYLRPDLTLFAYLHLAANRPLTEALLKAGTLAVAYETVVGDTGGLPLLLPMSEIAGRMAALAAGHHLLSPYGGPGLLMSGSPGVPATRVLVLGGGVVGQEAARVAAGIGAEVTVLELDPVRLREIERCLPSVRVLSSGPERILQQLERSDAVIGAALVPGAAAPRLVSNDDVDLLPSGSLLVDVAIDQGGCFEASRPTTHERPTYRMRDVQVYAVSNMPGAAPVTATQALTDATVPYVIELLRDLELGTVDGFHGGVNTREGRIEHPAVAATFAELPGGADAMVR